MRALRSCLPLATAASLVLACGGDGHTPVEPPPPPKPTAGIKIIAGGAATDTIGATIASPLTVEVHDSSGTLVAGAVVRFTSVSVKDPTGNVRASTLLESLDANQFSTFAAPTADVQGRAGVLVQLGMVAGPGVVAISVPAYGFADTVTYTIQPGAAASLSFQPSDTGVTVGGSVQLRAAVVDRYGNPRTDPVTYDPLDPSIATISSTGKVTGVAVGAQSVTARTGTVAKSGTVEVVPSGTIAAYYGGSYYVAGDSTGIQTLNLDGSNRQWLVRVGGSSESYTAPVWGPGGTIIYPGPQSTTVNTSRLFTVKAGTAPALLNQSAAANGMTEGWQQYNAATDRTFYSAHVAGASWALYWRLADGTISQISPEPAGTITWRPSPSPDGTKFAYVTTANYSPIIKVYDLKTGTASTWSVPGQLPQWSPKGDQIAYLPSGGGHIYLMNTDGSNQHLLSSGYYQEMPFSWSSDGNWIIAKSNTSNAMDVISTSTGAVVHLNYLQAYYYPAWK